MPCFWMNPLKTAPRAMAARTKASVPMNASGVISEARSSAGVMSSLGSCFLWPGVLILKRRIMVSPNGPHIKSPATMPKVAQAMAETLPPTTPQASNSGPKAPPVPRPPISETAPPKMP